MRHFSGEFTGMRLLMEDELELIAGGDGEDTDSTPVSNYENFWECWENGGAKIESTQGWAACSPGTITTTPLGNGVYDYTSQDVFYIRDPSGNYSAYNGFTIQTDAAGNWTIYVPM